MIPKVRIDVIPGIDGRDPVAQMELIYEIARRLDGIKVGGGARVRVEIDTLGPEGAREASHAETSAEAAWVDRD